MKKLTTLKKLLLYILQIIRDKISSNSFKQKHKMNNKNFTRKRKLPFSKMKLIMMKKGVKSIQNTLNETQIYTLNYYGL